MIVTHVYTAAESATHQTTTLKAVWWILERKTRRPPKKRNTERWRRAGNASTTRGASNSSRPPAKNARIRARLLGLYRRWVIVAYRRADCCNNDASMAHVILMAKLKNQSEFTQMADLDGEKLGGVVTADGPVTLVSPRT